MSTESTGPNEGDVRALTELLDLLYPDAGTHEDSTMTKNESAARYLLTSNWFVREGVAVATRAAASDAAFWASREQAREKSAGERAFLEATTPYEQAVAEAQWLEEDER